MTLRDAAGFFGKLPSYGDFVGRRLPAAFTGPWDAWLQAGLADSRAQLGEDWLPIYLNSPIWRFVLGAGVCGPQAWGGVLMPSVDRVGRYFPFTIAAGLDDGAIPAAAWYASLEALALPALGEGFSLPGFDAALLELAPPSADDGLLGDVYGASSQDGGGLRGRALFWQCDDAPPGPPSPVLCPDSLAASWFTRMLLPNSFN